MKFVALFVALACHAVHAADVHVVVSGGLTPAFKQLTPVFEKQTDTKVFTELGSSMGTTPTAVPMRLDRGENLDVVIMVKEAIAPLIAKHQVVADSVVDLARSKIAMAVKQGAPVPDISSVDAFKRTLLNAKSVAYSDSASGVYIRTEMYKRLGIEPQMTGKSRTILGTPVGESVVSGEFELGFQQYSELLAVKGVHIVGLIPEELQKVTIYSAAITSNAKSAAKGRELIRFLASPAASKAIRDSGLEPVTASAPAAK